MEQVHLTDAIGDQQVYWAPEMLSESALKAEAAARGVDQSLIDEGSRLTLVGAVNEAHARFYGAAF